jgi:hypothetical protein
MGFVPIPAYWSWFPRVLSSVAEHGRGLAIFDFFDSIHYVLYVKAFPLTFADDSPSIEEMGDLRLDLALHNRNWETALRLIEEGRGLRYTDTGWSVLHTAVWKNAPVEVCDALLRYLDPNRPEDSGETSVHYAMRYSVARPLLETLFRAGADPDARNANGETPLAVGINCFASEALLLCLLRHGIQLDEIDKEGRGAYELVKSSRNTLALNVLSRVEIALALCSARMIPRLGRRSPAAYLPTDLVRRLMTFVPRLDL